LQSRHRPSLASSIESSTWQVWPLTFGAASGDLRYPRRADKLQRSDGLSMAEAIVKTFLDEKSFHRQNSGRLPLGPRMHKRCLTNTIKYSSRIAFAETGHCFSLRLKKDMPVQEHGGAPGYLERAVGRSGRLAMTIANDGIPPANDGGDDDRGDDDGGDDDGGDDEGTVTMKPGCSAFGHL